ncbi:MAG: RIP metalloprotease RseP [Calditrichaeota bacterium]|nr:MAG: RIP metalloprotease RseP [Calditrichota bacterium]
MVTPVFAFIIVLGFLVFVHELGHFVVAKWIGVRVDVFSIGFGPKIVGFKRGDTDYRIAAIPLGGYVKMAGHDPGEELTGAKHEFGSRKVWQRMAIIAAGPIMNIIWAIIFIAVLFYAGVEKPLYYSDFVTIGWVEDGSPAADAGFRAGDKVLKVEGDEVNSWEKFYNSAALFTQDTVYIQVKRPAGLLDFTIHSNDSLRQAFPLLGISPPLPARVGRLVPGYPAEKAGIRTGDLIVKIGSDSIQSFYQMSRLVTSSGDSTLHISVARSDSILNFVLSATLDKNENRFMIGIAPFQETEKIRFGVIESLKRSVEINAMLSTLLGDFLARVLKGEASGEELGGPIKIAELAGEAARTGILDVIRLMGFLSLQLGLLNLLPIPVLDGGHLFLLTIEAVMRKPLSQGSREIVQMVGLVILITIMVFVFYNDIAGLLSRP